MMGTLGTVKDAAIGWVVQGILGKFTEKMEAWCREVDVAGDVENLKSEMLSTNTVVDAARGRKIENEGLSRSLLHLKQLLYDAEDVMDELDYYRLQRDIEGGNCDGSAAGTHPLGDRASSSAWSSALQKTLNAVKQIPGWVLGKHRKRKREDDTLLALESKHDTISQGINKIVTQLRTAREDVRRVLQLEISRPITMPYQSQSEPRNTRLTTSMQVEKKVYGREAERNRVVELLMNGKYSDLHVLPIVGGGGVGKTTLAKFVCDDQRIRSHFHLQMWVCVSTIFDQVRLTREMLEHACKDRQDYGKISSFNVLQDTLLENIRNKRFLLVLDDIWEDKDKNGWATLLAPLVRNQVPGCMILATTRSKSVAKMIGTMDAVEMKGLDEKEFWLLFEACAFGNENCTDHPSLHTIGQQIAKTLKGYPLAAQTVGALLKENLSYDHWRDVQETWKSRQENDGDILPILELSYDYLPSHLQHCFSYCSLFPEDHRFYGETLVHAWISQNFVQCDDTSKRLEEIGMRYLDRLVDLGFFQKVDSQDLRFLQKFDSHYVMHDLMHELAEKVSSNECANINGLQSKTIQPCIRHLSIITTAYDKDEHGSFPCENFEKILQDIRPLQKLRTLMFFGRSSVNLLRTRSFQILFKDAKSLRLLRIYVTGADIDSVLNFVKPYHLRYLEFIFVCPKNEDISFPEALTRLYHVQVLDFSYFSWKDTLLQDEYDSDMCSEFSGDTETEEESSPMDDSGPTSEPSRNTEREVLEGLEPHHNLKHLRISEYDGATSLQTLHLECCGKLQIIPSLQRLPFLRKFKLRNMLNVTEVSIPSLEELVLIKMPKLERCSCTSLRDLNSSLRVLKVTGCPVLKVFSLFEDCHEFKIEQKPWLPSVGKLVIRKCPQLLVPHPLPPSTSVSKLSIYEVSTLPSMEGSSSGTLTIGQSSEYFVETIDKTSDELRTLDGKMLSFHNLMFLTHLRIAGCRNLTYISFEGLRQLISLKSLEIWHCRELLSPRVLPEDTHEDMAAANCNILPSLERLCIVSCGVTGKWLSLMLRHVLALEELILEDCPPALEELDLEDCSSVEEEENLISAREASSSAYPNDELINSAASAPEGLLRIPSNLVSSLKKISFSECRDLTFYGSKDVFAGFTSLEELTIWGFPELLSSLVHKDGNDDQANGRWLLPQSLGQLNINCSPETLQPCFPGKLTCLKRLQVSWSPSLKSLQLHSCTALEELEVSDCESLASLEGLQSLGNLKALKLSRSRSLKYLQLHSCTALEELEVSGCDKYLQLHSCTALEELEVSGCESLASLVEGLQSPGNLKALKVSCIGSLKSIQLYSYTALEELTIETCGSLAALEGLQSLGGLRRLKVSWSPSLKSLQLHSCTALEELEIIICKSLAALEGLQSLGNLKALKVSSSPSLKSLPLHCCTALEELTIQYCESLAALEGLRSLGGLRRLAVTNCPGLSLSRQGYEMCPRLETLQIDDPSALTTSFCKHLTSLQHLLLWCPISSRDVINRLTDEQEEALQLLTSLQELTFGCFKDPIDLPAGLHSLRSLKKLAFFYCPGISRLPEKGLPPSLEQLDIKATGTTGSEELNEHCRMLATSKLKVRIY